MRVSSLLQNTSVSCISCLLTLAAISCTLLLLSVCVCCCICRALLLQAFPHPGLNRLCSAPTCKLLCPVACANRCLHAVVWELKPRGRTRPRHRPTTSAALVICSKDRFIESLLVVGYLVLDLVHTGFRHAVCLVSSAGGALSAPCSCFPGAAKVFQDYSSSHSTAAASTLSTVSISWHL